MKTKLTTLLLLITVSISAQSWKKGLIFNAPLDEYSTTWDQVNSVKGTGTDVYNVLDRQGSGRRSYVFDGVSNYAYIADADRYDFGTGDFSICFEFVYYPNSTKFIISKGAGGATGYGVYIHSDGKFRTQIQDINSTVISVANNTAMVSGTKYQVAIVFNRTGNLVYYLNGVADGSGSIATASASISNAFNLTFAAFKTPSDYARCDLSMIRLFNFALTAAQAANYSKPEYQIEYAHQGATNAEMVTNGDFTVDSNWTKGTGWTIDTGTGTISRTNVGTLSYIGQSIAFVANKNYRVSFTVNSQTNVFYCANNVSGSLFGGWTTYIAIPTVPTVFTTLTSSTEFRFYANNSATVTLDKISIIQSGCVLNLNAEGIGYGATTWRDRLNSIDATVSGATLTIPPASNLGGTRFNGTTSAVAFTGMNGLTGDISGSVWIYPIAFGENNAGRIIDNSKLLFYVNSSGYLTFSSDGSTVVNSGAASIAVNTPYHVAFTRTSSGVINFYINGALSGTANQASGTPASGTTWYVGNRAAGDRTFDGRISKEKIWSRILTADEILQLYNQGE